MLIFPAANDLLTLFVSLEVLSLPLYLLCGLARRRRLLSQEAAMKYFLLGAFSSGFFVYGIALTYGYAGSMGFAQIANAAGASAANRAFLLAGIALMAVGLLFKVSAAPFHAWTPDVYQGAPTAVTAFMAAATKVAAFGALLRLFYVAFGAEPDRLDPDGLGDRDPDHGGRLGARADPDRREAAARLLLDRARRVHPHRLPRHPLADRRGRRLAHRRLGGAVLPDDVRVHHARRVRDRLVVRDGGGEATHLSRWQGLGQRVARWSPACSRSCCWRWRASR